MNESFKKPSTQELHKKSMDAKIVAKEARLKTALRDNLKRRKVKNQTIGPVSQQEPD